MADGVSAGAEIVSNLAENVASQAAPAAAEAATQFTPDLAAAENLSAAVGGGAEGAFADDIMGDFQPEAVLKNMDAILPDVPSTQPIAPEMPPVGPLSTPLEGDLPVDSTPVEGTVPPVDGNLVEPPAPSSPAAEAAAAADGADAGAPEEPPADLTDVEPTGANAEPESVRDKLTSRISDLEKRKDLTPQEQRELTKSKLEVAERDRRDELNAAEPDSLTPEDVTDKDRLNEKYGKPNAEAAAEDTLPDASPSPEASEPVDPGKFDEKAIRDQIEADRNRRDWTQDQKDAYVNAQRAEHDKKKAEYDKAVAEKDQQKEQTTEQRKQELDQELQQVQQDLIDGKITAKEASERLTANRHARELIVKSLVERFKKGEEMTPFEKEVAEKSIQMQQLMREIQMAPKVMTAMEQTIKKLKAEYKKASAYQINAENADTPDTRQNVALRAQLSNQIAAQATHMARYADITAINVNEFKSVNSNLMSLIGVRGTLRNVMVQIGTGIRRKAKNYEVDIKARRIAQGWKV